MKGKSKGRAIVLVSLISIISFALIFAILYVAYLQGSDALFIAISVLGGIFWGWVIYWLYNDGRMTFSHILTIWMIFTGTIAFAYSYYLADKQSGDNLSDLSKYIILYVVATPAGYFLKSGIENGIRYLKKRAETSTEAAKVLEEITDPDMAPPDIPAPDGLSESATTTEADTYEDPPP